jgi:hypothetical protein
MFIFSQSILSMPRCSHSSSSVSAGTSTLPDSKTFAVTQLSVSAMVTTPAWSVIAACTASTCGQSFTARSSTSRWYGRGPASIATTRPVGPTIGAR